jgi:hypothetical protein
MHWVIQNNHISNQEQYIKSLDKLGIKYSMIEVVDGEIINLPKNELIWVSGSVGLVKKIMMNNKKAVSFENEVFLFKSMLDNYKNNCLNSDSIIVSIKDSKVDILFIKPNSSEKLFNARLISKAVLNDFKKRVRKKEFKFNEDELIVLSTRKNIYKEYRLFVVDGNIVSSCQYMQNSKLKLDKYVPNEAIVFGEKMISLWNPLPTYVLDIGLTKSGYKVVEINCINSSGTYLADTDLIVKSIERFFS